MSTGLVKTPISCILDSTAGDPYMKESFKKVIEKIYQYEIFKPFMDLSVTMIQQRRLKFVLAPQTTFELDEGNCVTIAKHRNEYTITIKKINSDVIIHEIGHMVEKEIGVDLNNSFKPAVVKDLKNINTNNISLSTAIKDVMISQVTGYHDSHKLSELFTRYFQLMAMAKEVAGYTAIYAYSVLDVYKAFPTVEDWIWNNLYETMLPKIHLEIARTSQAYIKPIEQIKHKHVERITPVKGNKPWLKSVKSIDD